MSSTAVPPQEPAAVSMSAWKESFWTAVNEHGWRHALKEIGWRPALKILGALVVTGFAELSRGTSSRPSVKSTGDVTREVLAELDVTPPPSNQEQSTDGDMQASSVVPVAVASAAVAIIPGSGTFLLRKMWDKERSKQEILEASRNEHAAIVDAVEGALSLPDSGDRNRLATHLAERLVQRAFADWRLPCKRVASSGAAAPASAPSRAIHN